MAEAEMAALKAELAAERQKRQQAELRQQDAEAQVASSFRLKSAIKLSSERAKRLKTVDIAFVFDCTASMQSYLKAAKKKIREIAKFILASMGEGASLRFAIVGYRDIGDDEPLVLLPFTTEITACERFLSVTRACGGGDVCEDVLSGLDAAAELDWQGKVRMLFLISQTPNHGERFHDHPEEQIEGKRAVDIFDAHRGLDRQWDHTDALLRRLQSMDVHLVCLEITDTTKKMFGVFASLYDDEAKGLTLQVVPMRSSPVSFCDAVTRATWSSIVASSWNSWSMIQSVGASPCLPRRGHQASLPPLEEEDVGTSCIDWEHMHEWKEMLVDLVSYTVDPAKIAGLSKPEDAVKKTIVRHSVRLASKPFGRGAMRLAYALFDETTGSKLVAKVYAFAGEEWESKAVFEGDMLSQAFAQYFAMEFSKRCDKTPVQFVQAQLMQPVNSCLKLMAVEPCIPGAYEKFTTNGSYVRPDSEIAQAYSHFTWHFSGGNMMVTDIQGVQTTLTDPQIHSENKCFGKGNFGIEGMDRFFMVHRCGATCKHLGVKQSPVQMTGHAAAVQAWPEQADDSDDSDDSDDRLEGLMRNLGEAGRSVLEDLLRAEAENGELPRDFKQLQQHLEHLRSDAEQATGRTPETDLLKLMLESAGEERQKSPGAAPGEVRVEAVTDTTARVCWRNAPAQHQDEHAKCRVAVWGPGDKLHFEQNFDGTMAEVVGLCADTEYQTKVAWSVKGHVGKPAVVRFSTLAGQTARTARGDAVQVLCDGKCGTFVDFPSGQHYLRQTKSGIYCKICQEKVANSMCEKACATDGCSKRVKYSVFQLECRGDEVPTLCKVCNARLRD